MKRISRFLLCAAACAVFQVVTAPNAYADALGATLSTYAVLGGSAVTNASAGGLAATVITGNLGVSPGTSCTGFIACDGGPGIITGTAHITDSGPGSAAEAQGQLTSAYNFLGGLGPGNLVVAGGLNGANLVSGVYSVTSDTFDLTSTLTLNATGDAFGSWVFLMSSSLITGTNATVDISSLGAGNSVYWVVRSSATLGDNTDFAGNILALTSIAFDPGATDLCGRALARNGLVSFAGVGTTIEPGESAVEANQVGGSCSIGSLNGGPGPVGNPVPEPGSLLLLGTGIAGLVARRRNLSLKA